MNGTSADLQQLLTHCSTDMLRGISHAVTQLLQRSVIYSSHCTRQCPLACLTAKCFFVKHITSSRTILESCALLRDLLCSTALRQLVQNNFFFPLHMSKFRTLCPDYYFLLLCQGLYHNTVYVSSLFSKPWEHLYSHKIRPKTPFLFVGIDTQALWLSVMKKIC